MSRKVLGVVVLGFVSAATAGSAEMPAPGKVTFAKDYPKPINVLKGETKGAVEVSGEYTTEKGWEPVACAFNYVPQAGGVQKTEKLTFADGKWGVTDEKTRKIVPAKFPMEKGKWMVVVAIQYKRTEANGTVKQVPVVTTWVPVEVK